jgi:hypothetical protein
MHANGDAWIVVIVFALLLALLFLPAGRRK